MALRSAARLLRGTPALSAPPRTVALAPPLRAHSGVAAPAPAAPAAPSEAGAPAPPKPADFDESHFQAPASHYAGARGPWNWRPDPAAAAAEAERERDPQGRALHPRVGAWPRRAEMCTPRAPLAPRRGC